MVSWFERDAPIRVKFRVLLLIYTIVGCCIAALAIYATLHAPDIDKRAVMMTAALGALSIPIITMIASRLICTPYVTTVVRMEGLAAGDLSSEVLYTANRDCVGRMTKAMASFRESSLAAAECNTQRAMATSMGIALERLAAGDLTYRIETELAGPFAKLREDFNAAAAALQAALTSVSEASGTIQSGSADISQATDDLSNRTEQQAASLEETAAAMHQITTTVKETAEHAEKANTVVVRACEDALQSEEVVRKAINAMGGIERSSSEISEIISVIDGIAFQTNLLALNAGVEAARAGDAGRGFAVVASEVRALAQRSADAARDVKTRITASTAQVEAGVELVADTGKALSRIISQIADIKTLVSSIALSADQQSSGLQQINTAIGEMDNVTQQNAAMVEQSNAAARSLSNEADELARQVGRFRTSTEQNGQETRAVDYSSRPKAAPPRRKIEASMRRSGGTVVPFKAGDEWSRF